MPGRPIVVVAMPYWDRPDALEAGLRSLQGFLTPQDRVVIIDDGTPSKQRPKTDHCFVIQGAAAPVYIVGVEAPHQHPRCSARAIFHALYSCVYTSKHANAPEWIILQNPETIWQCDIPHEFFGDDPDPEAYYVADCYDPSSKKWYEHPQHRPALFHWCVGAHSTLWEKALHDFEPNLSWLMKGHWYEDNVLRNCVLQHAAEVRRRGYVHHRRDLQALGAKKGDWDPRLVAHNRAAYFEHWPDARVTDLRKRWGFRGE